MYDEKSMSSEGEHHGYSQPPQVEHPFREPMKTKGVDPIAMQALRDLEQTLKAAHGLEEFAAGKLRVLIQPSRWESREQASRR